jgi:hypothetical protein
MQRKSICIDNGQHPKGAMITHVPDYKMLPYGAPNDPYDGDCGANFQNARKSCFARKDGKGHHRKSIKKRRFRTSMNRITRQIAKQNMRRELGF